MRATEKEEQAIMECYIMLYENSTPSADFKQLMEEAPMNEFNQKVIDYMAYEIEEKLCMEIIDFVIKKNKIRKYARNAFKTSILLGCSPKFKKEDVSI